MNWKASLSKLLENGCSDSDIEDFVDRHPKISGKAIWDYVYECSSPIECKGCKHIQMKGMYPCNVCVRQKKLKDYYEV